MRKSSDCREGHDTEIHNWGMIQKYGLERQEILKGKDGAMQEFQIWNSSMHQVQSGGRAGYVLRLVCGVQSQDVKYFRWNTEKMHYGGETHSRYLHGETVADHILFLEIPPLLWREELIGGTGILKLWSLGNISEGP